MNTNSCTKMLVNHFKLRNSSLSYKSQPYSKVLKPAHLIKQTVGINTYNIYVDIPVTNILNNKKKDGKEYG